MMLDRPTSRARSLILAVWLFRIQASRSWVEYRSDPEYPMLKAVGDTHIETQ